MSEPVITAGASGPDAASVVVTATPANLVVPSPEARTASAIALLAKADFMSPETPDAPATPAPESPAEPKAAPAAPPSEPLAAVIRAQREARQAAQGAKQHASSLEQELKAVKDELQRVKSDRQAFEDDPVGYAKARNWTKDQQLLYGQSLLYDIVPDKADPNFRIKMFEDKQRRDRAAQDASNRESQDKAAQEAAQAQISGFIHEVDNVTRTFTAGSYPESEAWFGNDRESYLRSLVATAQNLATVATQNGQVADLSPAGLAATLEAEMSRRMAERDKRTQSRKAPVATPAATAPSAVGGMQSAETASTRNMNGAGTPVPPATTDKERIKRAVEAAFRSR